MRNRNKIAAIIFLLSLLFGVIYITSNLNYQQSEISADNYEKLLSPSQSSILYGTSIDNFFPDKFPVTMAHEFSNSDNFRGNGISVLNKKTNDGNLVEITSYKSGMAYNLSFSNQSLNYAWVFKSGLMDETIPETLLINNMIRDLILNDGFTIKKTEQKNGGDIIIKETNEYFVIGDISGEFDSKLFPPQSISFKSYRKTKYLNSFRWN